MIDVKLKLFFFKLNLNRVLRLQNGLLLKFRDVTLLLMNDLFGADNITKIFDFVFLYFITTMKYPLDYAKDIEVWYN